MNQRFGFLFILIYSSSAGRVTSSESLVPQAIKAVIDQYATADNREIEIINFGVKNGEGEKVIERVLKIEGMKLAIANTRDVREDFKGVMFMKSPCILFFDSVENYYQSFQRVLFSSTTISYHHLFFYIHEAQLKDIEIRLGGSFFVGHVNILIESKEGSIELATLLMCSPEVCFKDFWEVINRFNRNEMKWENSDFFVDKYKNFHKCPLEVLGDMKGLYLLLSDRLNFTPVVIDDWSKCLFYIINLGPNIAMLRQAHIMDILLTRIFIPLGEIYGSYEKMLLPFDTFTWVCIALTIFVSFCAIVFMQWFSPNNQEIIFGRNNRSLLMNFVSIILNGSQPRNLVENVPRIFLMTFMFWSLIFR
jgi:hypothetical protein